MEVVAPYHPQITPGNSPHFMFSMNPISSEVGNCMKTDHNDAILTATAFEASVKTEEVTENGKVAEEQDEEDTIVCSDVAESALSENSCESPPFKSAKPSEKDQKQIDFLVKGLPAVGQLFDLHHKIGEGTFSSVFLATLRNIQPGSQFSNKQFAIKHLVPTTHPSRAERELKCLQQIGGRDNVIGVHLCLRNLDSIAFVMPYLPHRRFSEYVLDMDSKETRLYMRNLLLALCRVHSFNIIHRDVKPSNFLYDRETKQFLLVDFGLSQPVEETAPPKKIDPEQFVSKKRKRF